MYFNIQIPLLDTRPFLITFENAFFTPSKIVNNKRAPFCRSFGQLHYRKNETNLPLSELQFIESRKAIKFSESFPKSGLLNITERLFEDNYVSHFDIGIKTRGLRHFTYKKFKIYLKNMLESELFKNNKNFIKIPADIASKYQKATTYRKKTYKSAHNLVFCNHPLLFVEYHENEITQFPNQLYTYQVNKHVDFKYDSLHLNGMVVHIWYIKKGTHSENAEARQIRIALSKIYHNQMSVEKFINWYEYQDKSTINDENTLDYIKQMLHTIRKQKKKVENKDIYNQAIHAYKNVHGQRIRDSRSILKEKHDKLLDIKKESKVRNSAFTSYGVNI